MANEWKEKAESLLSNSMAFNVHHDPEPAKAFAAQAQAAALLALVETVENAVDQLDLHNVMAQLQVMLNRHF